MILMEEVIYVINPKLEKGQGLLEYALILVLVAIVIIAALTLLGPTVGDLFSNVNSDIEALY